MAEPREVRRVVAAAEDYGWGCAAYSFFPDHEEANNECAGYPCCECPYYMRDGEPRAGDILGLYEDDTGKRTVKLVKAGEAPDAPR